MRLDLDTLTGGDRYAAQAHADALYRAHEPLYPDDVEALLATPAAWAPVRSRVATALLQHALRTDDPALVTRVRGLGPFSQLAFGGLPPRCLRAALVGLAADGVHERFATLLRFWSVKVNVCDFSVVADVRAGELGSRKEGTGPQRRRARPVGRLDPAAPTGYPYARVRHQRGGLVGDLR